MALFQDLREPLLSPGDKAFICRGVATEVAEGQTLEDYVAASLEHNYSPHLAATLRLRRILLTTARDCLRRYLILWRQQRPRPPDDSCPADRVRPLFFFSFPPSFAFSAALADSSKSGRGFR